MEKLANQKRNWRLEMAFAALDVAGRAEEVSIMDGFLPADRRRYLHHDPEAGPEGDLGTDRLSGLLAAEQVPHAIDLDQASENFGVRYIPASVPVPRSLEPFTRDEARSSWCDWKKEQDDMKEAVTDILKASKGSGPIFRDETLADRVNTRVNEMKVTKPVRHTGARAWSERD